MASTPPPFMQGGQTYQPYQVSQQQTMPSPAVSFPPAPPITPTANFLLPARYIRKKKFKQVIPFGIAFILVLVIIGIWFTSPSTATPATSPGVTQQNFGTSANAINNTSSGSIRVYIVGAVKNPGVYTLTINARVYDLLQAAGGPQAKADLVTLNLAAKLTDGEEVYVTLVGEVPPTYLGGVPGPGATSGTPNASGTATTGQLVNINTASADDMRLNLHVSSTTAQNIVNFRLQHGPYTSVDQLLQVVSKSIYDKIKGQVTV
ncbi:MAG TPA: ComEA family DNA-binding protein [Ktedonobacteraceae bacterium]|nr:ComEA family DNA-binding protein [Ktedonobacteraceae bacterium]